MNKSYFNNIRQVINKEIKELKESYMSSRLKRNVHTKVLISQVKIETLPNSSVITKTDKESKITLKSRL
jgi:hypothetical protein